MFNKLIEIQDRKIELLQKQKAILNNQILTNNQNISILKKESIQDSTGDIKLGLLVSTSMHFKAINQEISKLEEDNKKKYIEIVALNKKIQKESIDLEKYKHIEEQEKLKKIKKLQDLESLEIDEFVQKKYSVNF